MNARKFLTSISVLVLLSTAACSTVNTQLAEVVLDKFQADLQRTNELAVKYNSPAVAQCTQWLAGATAGVTELANERVDGIFSAAFKAALLRRMGTQYEDLFAENCGGVAARMLVELGRKAPIPGRP